ncbi:MAG: corrinoid protein [Christensenellales bacterium]|jgi:corrinoid protein of di/trimethylamine methyltransferase
MENILSEINELLQKGRAKQVKALVQQALDEGIEAGAILSQGLLGGMSIIGEKFKNNEVYVPEVMIAARAMNMGMEVLKPVLVQADTQSAGKVVIGTVKGDLHDIGKNLVKIMFESKGFDVIDLGTDVSPEAFVSTAAQENADIIACSALLTTTMTVMKDVVEEAKNQGIREKVIIMVGGAPVTEHFCESIGADIFEPDATSASESAYARLH